MISPEKRRTTPLEYVRQIAKETVGIGQAQRYKTNEGDLSKTEEGIRVGSFVAANILQPFAVRYFETHTRIEQVSTAGVLGAFAEWGINIGAILLALNGHIAEGVATKVIYNTGVNVLLGPVKSTLQETS